MNQSQVAVSISVASPAGVSPLVLRGAAVVLGSVLVAVCAHVSVPLLFTPVPLTLQTFAVLLLGLTLGPGTAFAALTLYLIEGAAGLPVFSPHGPGGILQLMGPTGGYLLSYPFAAALAGFLAQRMRATFTAYALAAAAGSVVILALGASWFAIAHQSLGTALNLTVWPFLPGDALKVCASAAAALGFFKLRNRFRGPSGGLNDTAGV
jgi:biotin transport system substrate-specific component